MRWRTLLAAIMIVVGVAAVGLVVLGPVGGATPASQIIETAVRGYQKVHRCRNT